MTHFEFVTDFKECGLPLPKRETEHAAGYDLAAVQDTIIPPYSSQFLNLLHYWDQNQSIELTDLAKITKETKNKPTLVNTGLKCQLKPNQYLKLVPRSSTPLKYWLVLANGEGIIDSDYYNNEGNEGCIYFQFINFAPYPIKIKKGDILGQGIIQEYQTVDNEEENHTKRVGGFGSTSEDRT